MAEIAVSLAAKQAEGLVGKLVDRLYSAVSGELSLLLGVRGEIQYIRDELVVMSAFLRRAEEKQNSDPVAKAWVEQVKELAYAVEDCIDEFALHLQHGDSRNFAHALWRRARSLGSLSARRRIATDIQSIKSRVEEVSKRRLRYGIDDKASSTSDDDVSLQYDPRSAALFLEDSQLVGIDGPREKLVEWLLDGQPSLSLMAVVGAGGLGKTTVVKRVVESPKVTGGHFQCRAWVTVSQVYVIERLLRDMIKQIFSSPPQNLERMDEMRLIRSLKEHLEDKRYTIVFDDIWKVDAWKSLEVALPKNTNGSRIIITTRIDDVARACLACNIPGDIHVQQKLSEDDSWDLFCRRVFFDRHVDCPEELKILSQKILRKCDGLPLAIVAVAAALASKPKKTSEEWRDMLRHLSTELESNPNLRGVIRVLNFSYTDLPYHVKRCFLYISKFPEDSLINSNRVKRLWIAEGLVCAQRGRRAEEVAESYLNVLVNRSLIIPSKLNCKGRVKSFTVHDMMMEMIVSKSIEENFVSLLIPKDDDMWLPQGAIRRLSISVARAPEELSLSHARSLTMSDAVIPSSILSRSPALRLLRVLDLEGCRHLKSDHLNVACRQLLHLKYLSLRHTKVYGLHVVPDSIGNLRNLETLDLRDCIVPTSDKTATLRITLPAKILELKRLRFLRGNYLSVPAEIRKLRAIQELGCVSLNKGMAKDLLYLNQLKKLQVRITHDFEGKDGSDFCDFLQMKKTKSLRSLQVCTDNNLTFLKDLSSPPVTLEKLSLFGSLGALPEWVSSLRNLHKISFERIELGGDDIQALGALPSLLELDLIGGASYREEELAFGAEGFRSLKVFGCKALNVRSLIFEQGALPCVESVRMVSLSKVEKEGIRGLENLTCLKTVEILWMDDEVEAVVKQKVEAHPNHPKIIIN